MFNSFVDNHQSPNRSNLDLKRNKSGVFTSAGRAIAHRDDPIQHNYIYKSGKDTKRQEHEENERSRLYNYTNQADIAGMAKANPVAYKSYMNNLEKLNDNLNKVDAYTNEIQRAREKIYTDQKNVENLDNLNRFNDKQHRQHIANQMQRIREPITHKNFAFVRDHPVRKQPDPLTKQPLSDEDYAAQNDLLDQFSASHNLDDQLSKQRRLVQLRQRPDLNLSNLNLANDSSFSNPPTKRGYENNYAYNQPQFNPQPQPQFNPYPQIQPQPYYGFNPQSLALQPSISYVLPPSQNESPELKSYLQRQNDLLESINRRMNNRSRERTSHGRSGLDSRILNSRFREHEKETDLRLQLMKQQQLIENLQNQPQQQQLQSNNSNPQSLATNFMQFVNPFQYGDMFPNYLTPQYNPLYNPMYNNYGYPGYDPYAYGYPMKTKSDKKKKKKRNTSSSEDSSENSRSPDDKDKRRKSRKSKSSKRNKDKEKLKAKRPESIAKIKEDEEKLKAEKKKIAKSNLKKIMWTIVYPTIFDTDVSKKVIQRRQIQQADVDEKFDPLVQNLATWMMNVTQEGFTKLIDDGKKSYDFIGLDFKKLSKSDMTKRINDCKVKVKALLDTLVAETNKYPLDQNILGFLATLSYDPVYAADKVYSNFELMRLRFNSFGRVLDLSKAHSHMLIGSLLVVRILVFQLVFKASEWNKKPKWTEQLMANFKIVACIIYRLACSIWEEQLPIINPNPEVLLPQRILPLSMDPGLLDSEEPEMILGAISKNQLAPLLEDKQWCDSAKHVIADWTEMIYKKLEGYRRENPRKKIGEEKPKSGKIPSIKF